MTKMTSESKPAHTPVTIAAYSRKRTVGFSAFGGAIGVTDCSQGREFILLLCRIGLPVSGGAQEGSQMGAGGDIHVL